MILIQGGRVIDPANQRDGGFDLLINEHKILQTAKKIIPPKHVEIVPAKGCWVLPGLIDTHVHLREPGNEESETIETGSHAAAAGGVTSLLAMANTNPPIDSVQQVRFILRKAKDKAIVRIYSVGTITKNLEGKELIDLPAMAREGCVAFSDDGHCVMNSLLLKRALEYCKRTTTPVIDHCEDENLSYGGVMNEKTLSAKLGLRGIPSVSESIMVARDIALAELTGSSLHCAHISTSESVNLIRMAKKNGIPITAETCPHYFTITEDMVRGYNTSAKVKPPLGTPQDISAICAGLADGTIDNIASDHAPHHTQSKERGFSSASFGMIGLETLFSLSYNELILRKKFSAMQAVKKFTQSPAKIFHLRAGTLSIGAPADLAIFNPQINWTVNRKDFFSKSSNSPFIGRKLKGKITLTMVNGKIVYRNGKILAH